MSVKTDLDVLAKAAAVVIASGFCVSNRLMKKDNIIHCSLKLCSSSSCCMDAVWFHVKQVAHAHRTLHLIWLNLTACSTLHRSFWGTKLIFLAEILSSASKLTLSWKIETPEKILWWTPAQYWTSRISYKKKKKKLEGVQGCTPSQGKWANSHKFLNPRFSDYSVFIIWNKAPPTHLHNGAGRQNFVLHVGVAGRAAHRGKEPHGVLCRNRLPCSGFSAHDDRLILLISDKHHRRRKWIRPPLRLQCRASFPATKVTRRLALRERWIIINNIN